MKNSGQRHGTSWTILFDTQALRALVADDADGTRIRPGHVPRSGTPQSAATAASDVSSGCVNLLQLCAFRSPSQSNSLACCIWGSRRPVLPLSQSQKESPTQGQDASCVRSALDLETRLCRTGTAWGLLDGQVATSLPALVLSLCLPVAASADQLAALQPGWVLLAYWLVRHSMYMGAFTGLLMAGVNVFIPMVVVFFVAHGWKLVHFLRLKKEEDRKAQQMTSNCKA